MLPEPVALLMLAATPADVAAAAAIMALATRSHGTMSQTPLGWLATE
jgi:hypothetical protein